MRDSTQSHSGMDGGKRRTGEAASGLGFNPLIYTPPNQHTPHSEDSKGFHPGPATALKASPMKAPMLQSRALRILGNYGPTAW